ncbi:LAME_0H08394g1_1 [Lachancea meyersii CBS 8951]|uniref:LAME_0H08394g1_1 n=1 Tax=Lachancea meyersii CBS 8951 TaxID=1266667 RepID=A0A1G4KFH3_9SACH|nr:LAME_0H08394g1_1 [Lachancea meyersii CBS 8951]
MTIVANRAVTFVNNKSLPVISSQEIDLDTCYGDNEIVVKVHAAALNPIDWLMYQLAFSWFAGSEKKTFSRDYSGEIVKVGSSVENFEIGDKVVGLFEHILGPQGSLSDYLVFNPTKQCALTKMPACNDPKYSDYVLNAAWPLVFGTAYKILFGYGQKLGPGSKILVIGASTSVSNALVQIAKNYLNVETVVGICSKKSFEYNKALGYDHLVAYDEDNTVEKVVGLVKDKFENGKFDLVFDSVGNSDFFPRIHDVLKSRNEGSYYLTIAGDHKIKYANLSLWSILQPSWEMLKRYGPFRKYNYAYVLLNKNPKAMALGAQLIAEKKYKPAIDSVYEFGDYADAFKTLCSYQVKGKVVVKID